MGLRDLLGWGSAAAAPAPRASIQATGPAC
jgi:hypothetical protein